MLARISTIFDCTEETFWGEILKPQSLQYVSSPILSFRSLREGELEEEWETDIDYDLKLSFLFILPLGRHRIRLTKIDKESNTIVSNESGRLVPVWNHTIRFHQIEGNRLFYSDEVEIRAGLLTSAIWFFAHFFYRHRQRRWKRLLKEVG
jgi:hypothetical protein